MKFRLTTKVINDVQTTTEYNDDDCNARYAKDKNKIKNLNVLLACKQ